MGQGEIGLKVEGGRDIHVDFGAVSVVILRVLRQKSGCVEERSSLVNYSLPGHSSGVDGMVFAAGGPV